MTFRDAGLHGLLACLGLAAAACQPTVRVEAPKDPIVVNLNVKIEHEVRIRVEKDVEELFQDNPDLF
ncbi:MAG TPA: YnbE family lipoprotein [Myxococcota bacterium]|nr:YnbE family lipoprotein [Myxococcota bacterium]